MGRFGHLIDSPILWGFLAALFFFGLFDFKRPWRIVHLDLLVLLSFGFAQIWFHLGEDGIWVPLAYPPLVYLLGRMLWVGFRGERVGLRPSVPVTWLAIALVALVTGRIGLNVIDSGTIDVGHASVVGADKVTSGETVWGQGEFPRINPEGDSYGPVNYYAYVPFELAFPFDGEWDELPASHAASIVFDLAVIAGLLFLGPALRRAPPDADPEEQEAAKAEGTALGIVLAFAWCAYPYTTFELQSNSNDALMVALIVWALVAFASPVRRGLLLGFAAMTKFMPFLLAPLFATGERGLLDRLLPTTGDEPLASRLKSVVIFSAVFLATVGVLLIHPALDPGLETFYDRTARQPARPRPPLLALGPGAGPGLPADADPGGVGRPRRAPRVHPPPPDARAVRGARRGGRDRRPDRPRPLVLPLHPLVLRPLAGGDGAAGAGHQPAGQPPHWTARLRFVLDLRAALLAQISGAGDVSDRFALIAMISNPLRGSRRARRSPRHRQGRSGSRRSPIRCRPR